jgi:hypothetical protein
MQKKYIYSILGLFVGAFVNILFNLVAAAIQQRAIGDKFNDKTIWWIAIFAVAGLLVGYWLSIKTESANGFTHKGGIRAKGITSNRGRFIADERTGQGIDAEDVRARGDVSLTSSNSDESSTQERILGGIDARALNAGGNIAILNASVPLPEQLEYFRNQLNISSTRSNGYDRLKIKSYWDVWRKLHLLRLAGDDLWGKLNDDNILTFSKQLRETQDKVEESAIFFDEEDYINLKNLLETFENFKLGKVYLGEIRSSEDLRFVSIGLALQQIEINRKYKDKYESLLDKIRVTFRERLCS